MSRCCDDRMNPPRRACGSSRAANDPTPCAQLRLTDAGGWLSFLARATREVVAGLDWVPGCSAVSEAMGVRRAVRDRVLVRSRARWTGERGGACG